MGLRVCLERMRSRLTFFPLDLLTSVKKDFDVDRQGLQESDYLHFFTVYSFFLEFHLATHEVPRIINLLSDISDPPSFVFFRRARMI